jgi:hypothetical protein
MQPGGTNISFTPTASGKFGDEKSTLFWDDAWQQLPPLSQHPTIAILKEIMIRTKQDLSLSILAPPSTPRHMENLAPTRIMGPPSSPNRLGFLLERSTKKKNLNSNRA